MTQYFKTDPDDKIIVSIQDHWVVLLTPLMFYGFSWGLSLLLYRLAGELALTSPLLSEILIVLGLVVLVFAHHGLFIFLISWEVSTWIITTKAVSDFRFIPYVQHDTEFILIHEIHEIEKRKHGIIKNILNYGEIEINLAAIPRSIIFKYVPNPTKFINLVHTLQTIKPSESDVENLREMYKKDRLYEKPPPETPS